MIDKVAIGWTIAIVAVSIGLVFSLQSSTMSQTIIETDATKLAAKPILSEPQRLVTDAITLYEKIGTDAFDVITSDFKSDESYVFVIDVHGLRYAHAGNPDLVGVNVSNDPDNPIVDILVDGATSDGSWVTYKRALPGTTEVHQKESWVVIHDSFIFGAGQYEQEIIHDRKLEAQSLVDKAISEYHAKGTDSFLEFDFSTDYHDEELYVFVVKLDDSVVVAHGAEPREIGMEITGLYDADGVNIGTLFLENVTEDGVWVNYKWLNPSTDRVQDKLSWIKSYDGYLFGVGVYE